MFDCLQAFNKITDAIEIDTSKDLNSLVKEATDDLTATSSEDKAAISQIGKMGRHLYQITLDLGTEGKEIAAMMEPLLLEQNTEASSLANDFAQWVLRPKADPSSHSDSGPRERKDRGDRGGRDRGGRGGDRDHGGRGGRPNNRQGSSKGGNFRKGKNNKTPEEAKAAATVENGIRALKANGNLREIDLEASNSFHRRLQHEAVKGSGFFSYSRGDDTDRRVVLTREKPVPEDDFEDEA